MTLCEKLEVAYIVSIVFIMLFGGSLFLINTFSPYKGTVQKRAFIKADPNGSAILESLIKKEVLEKITSRQSKRAAGRFRLTRKYKKTGERPNELSGENFDYIWKALTEGIRRKRTIKTK